MTDHFENDKRKWGAQKRIKKQHQGWCTWEQVMSLTTDWVPGGIDSIVTQPWLALGHESSEFYLESIIQMDLQSLYNVITDRMSPNLNKITPFRRVLAHGNWGSSLAYGILFPLSFILRPIEIKVLWLLVSYVFALKSSIGFCTPKHCQNWQYKFTVFFFWENTAKILIMTHSVLHIFVQSESFLNKNVTSTKYYD